MLTTENTAMTRRRARKYTFTVTNNVRSDLNPIVVHAYDLTEMLNVKNEICKQLNVPQSEMRLMYRNTELRSGSVESYRLRTKTNLKLVAQPRFEQNKGYVDAHVFVQDGRAAELEHALTLVRNGLYQGIKPKAFLEQGTSGTYFLESVDRKYIAVFKPYDEEYNTPNNPRGFAYRNEFGAPTDRPGIQSGEMAAREVAAYLLDHYYGGVHKVPPTTWVNFYHPSFVFVEDPNEARVQRTTSVPLSVQQQQQKRTLSQSGDARAALEPVATTVPGLKPKEGSFQVFQPYDKYFENIGWQSFDADNIHRIGLLDVRILNKDRNSENILARRVDKTLYELFPIDHGYSLPDDLNIQEEWIAWMSCPQAKKAFSAELVDFVKQIDPVEDCRRIQQCLQIREECLLNLRIAEHFLKRAVAAGLTLYNIGRMLYREDEDTQSKVEQIVSFARHLYKSKKKIEQKTNVHFQQHLRKTLTDKQRQLHAGGGGYHHQSSSAQSQHSGDRQAQLGAAATKSGSTQEPKTMGTVMEEDDESAPVTGTNGRTRAVHDEEEMKAEERPLAKQHLPKLKLQVPFDGANVQQNAVQAPQSQHVRLQSMLRCVSAPEMRDLDAKHASKASTKGRKKHRREPLLQGVSIGTRNQSKDSNEMSPEHGASRGAHDANVFDTDLAPANALQRRMFSNQFEEKMPSPLNPQAAAAAAAANDDDEEQYKISWGNELFFDSFEFVLENAIRRAVEQQVAEQREEEMRAASRQGRRARFESVEIHDLQ